MKNLVEENKKLVKKLEEVEASRERDKEKIASLVTQTRHMFMDQETFRIKSKKIMSTLLIELENMKRQTLLREITDEKSRLGFFSFSNSFGRNMEDWIEGVEIRKLLQQKVGIKRLNYAKKGRNLKKLKRNSNHEKERESRKCSMVTQGMR